MSDSARARIVHEESSPYGTVYVVDEDDLRTLRLGSPDGPLQSAVLKSDPLAVPTNYVHVATAGLAFTSGRARALVVGLGGGSFPLSLHRRLPRVRLDVVEHNPVVVDVARRFFGVREDDRLSLHVEDGAQYMRRCEERYDLIFLDAFTGGGTPRHLKEVLFLQDVARALAPGGAAVLNVALEEPRAVGARIHTFARAFADCALLRGASEYNNVLLVGTQTPVPSEAGFRERLEALAHELRWPELVPSVKSFKRVRVPR